MDLMQGIQGLLETLSLADVLGVLVTKGVAGTVRCEQGPLKKNFVIEAGHAIMASSSDPREYLGQFLINFGHITEEQLDEAFETQKQTHVYLGKILLMIGLVDEETLKAVLILKIRETVLSLLEWDHGVFHFAPDEMPEREPAVKVAVDLQSLREEYEFRQTAWASIRQIFPDDKLGLKVDQEKARVDRHPLDGRILEAAAGGASIEQIALTLRATPFALYQRLFALYREGIVEPVELGDEVEIVDLGEIPEVLGEKATADQILPAAVNFLAEGKYAEARLIAKRAVEMTPRDEHALATLHQAETGLLAQLKAHFAEIGGYPTVIARPDEIKALSLTPAERYLLRRFNGKKTLPQVIQVSPMRELEALLLVQRFLEKGIVWMEAE